MQLHRSLLALLIGASAALSGCQNMNTDSLVQSGMMAMKAATLSDAEIKQVADEACAKQDAEAQIAPASSPYVQRLDKIAAALGNPLAGTAVNYKVYLTDDINAFAMANGCVRVYSGLMDLMNDNEVEGVLGHEIGHVALGHVKKATQTAYATAAARGAAAASGNATVAALSQSQLGEIGEALVNAQFSQSQESAADDYSFDLLKKRNIPLEGLATAFDKLAKLSGGKESSMFDSHPGSQQRADHIRKRIASGK
ncbi:M48 family metalloprotease [Pseudomonas sp. GD04087]|uniref:metalloprotease LoiP n=1 Tax=Pseudomonas TaxID=286 RepID=UPI00244786F9|nr:MULTISPECIES: M48 family metalloprotease [Pseudomonas]MCP1647736.1 putative metalloprotease [Pseudomonas nitroreducens]MCP1686312.1 putative metalloprotease [Pseudomonas nitroreducens]MDH0292475.1 M48 family metalloprotease [Pseudomonas sp. GD04087]MDH1050587.1 M48 family metalloprotease [Pseudomonas sp. GD03903]MDH2002694.1 M48 family metalloprotease [Pseudomonas sp. GD03691]